jgi:hypothetical protein
MKQFRTFLHLCLGWPNVIFFGFSCRGDRMPSTTITSNQMEMLRRATHNEFLFSGQVRVNGKNLYAECDELWVCSLATAPSSPKTYPNPFTDVCRVRQPSSPLSSCRWSYIALYNGTLPSGFVDQRNHVPRVGQIQQIVALRQVFLETNDPVSGEVKRARSGKAIIYPDEGRMVLTDNPTVSCSIHGTFSGEKITFFKYSERVIVENDRPQHRVQAVLADPQFDL